MNRGRQRSATAVEDSSIGKNNQAILHRLMTSLDTESNLAPHCQANLTEARLASGLGIVKGA
jgi:hypothetical protein